MNYKQAIILRKDLRMGAGKAAVQAAHASVEAVFLILLDTNRREWKLWLTEWRKEGQKKVALRVNDYLSLVKLYNEAKARGLPSVIIRDAGLTQLPPGTATAVSIGPAPTHIVDEITGGLKLY